MGSTALLDLRRFARWEPSRLLADTFEWPTQAPTVALNRLVSFVAPSSFADAGTPVVTPADVDSMRGGIRRRSRRYQGAAYQVGAELRPGDLLVPRAPSGLVLQVSGDMMGALISSAFYALRPTEDVAVLWLWAVLNCRSGLRLRESLAAGASTSLLTIPDLLGMNVPDAPRVIKSRLLAALKREASTTHLEEDDAPETWWRTVDLRGSEWRLMLASPRPDLLRAGIPLSDFCTDIVKGRAFDGAAVETQHFEFLPVMDIQVLAGRPPRRWVPATAAQATRVSAGDLCVAETGDRAHATVIESDAVADPHIYVLRLRESEFAPSIARYLNGREGYALRRMLTSGAGVPHLRMADLKRLPVRPEALERGVSDPFEMTNASLPDRLERTLWKN